MSEQTSQEPTMEEILASIRRIISEDDAGPADAADTPPAPTALPGALEVAAAALEVEAPAADEPEPVTEMHEDEDDDALELTDKVESVGDLDVYTPGPVADEPMPAPVVAPAPTQAAIQTLVSERAASAAASAFGQLSAAIAMPKADRSLEDVVRELLRPLLQQWLDDNLPAIVQQAVEAEVERIARGRVR
jgi:cell pole-organizing protein PopZ